MKRNLLLLAMAIIGLSACHNQSDKIKAFIPGTYTKSVSGEFSSAKDTLVISVVDETHFNIERHTTYQVLRNGKLLPEQHHTEILSGTYDEQQRSLVEITKGKVFTFDPAKQELVVNGKGVYRKLN